MVHRGAHGGMVANDADLAERRDEAFAGDGDPRLESASFLRIMEWNRRSGWCFRQQGHAGLDGGDHDRVGLCR
ncbi:hypothetical protein NKJ92_31900 [Mesorhizobium sp. M0026]|uniref:hypothetical protein n=1 Tax=Mesorhizobium sp. M0026 TaxID=2956847 RepID=UPI0033360121